MSVETLQAASLQNAPSPASTTAPGSARAKDLLKYAQEFEASLIKDWWKAGEESMKGDDSTSESEGMGDLGAQALAEGIAARGGFGVANMLVHSLLGGKGKV